MKLRKVQRGKDTCPKSHSWLVMDIQQTLMFQVPLPFPLLHPPPPHHHQRIMAVLTLTLTRGMKASPKSNSSILEMMFHPFSYSLVIPAINPLLLESHHDRTNQTVFHTHTHPPPLTDLTTQLKASGRKRSNVSSL